jgi:hypothetical protein
MDIKEYLEIHEKFLSNQYIKYPYKSLKGLWAQK